MEGWYELSHPWPIGELQEDVGEAEPQPHKGRIGS